MSVPKYVIDTLLVAQHALSQDIEGLDARQRPMLAHAGKISAAMLVAQCLDKINAENESHP